MKRTFAILGALAGAGALAIGAPAALAGPPPPSSADAVAAQVDGLVAVSHTNATAGPDGGSATADPVEVGGKPPATQFGGSQHGAGTANGSLADTGDTPLGRVKATPWRSTVGSSGGGTTSHGDAAILTVDLFPQNGKPIVSLALLRSASDATWGTDQSTGHSDSDGATVGLADQLELMVLHAETNSSSPGSSALLVVDNNGQQTAIGTGDQIGKLCNIDAAPLIQLVCVTAAGGNGTPSAAKVLGTELLGNNQLTGDVVGATSTGGGSTAETGGSQGTGVEGNQTPNPAPAAPAAASAPLARTGAAIGRELAIALAIGALGVAVLGLARARRAALLVP